MKQRQFTSTVFIFHEDKVLLIFHKKLQKWLPPGGHMNPNELPTECAIREAKEETGLDVELVSQENIWVNNKWNGKSFERPYMCLLEDIPAINGDAAHQHIDFIYLGKPIGGTLIFNEEETEKLRWFTLEDVEQLKIDHDTFEECQMVIRQILKPNLS